jgi:hypothetical protein
MIAALGMVFGISACEDGKKSGADKDKEVLSGVRAARQAAVPYPLAQMKAGGWLESQLLKENLLRQNDKNRIAYVVLLSAQGQPITQYTIQGMVFSLNSQLTQTNQSERHGSDSSGTVVVDAVGDNGTFGPEPDGIGFFTTSGVEVKWNGLYIESDAPLNVTTKPLVTYNVTDKPSVDKGGVKTR